MGSTCAVSKKSALPRKSRKHRMNAGFEYEFAAMHGAPPIAPIAPLLHFPTDTPTFLLLGGGNPLLKYFFLGDPPFWVPCSFVLEGGGAPFFFRSLLEVEARNPPLSSKT